MVILKSGKPYVKNKCLKCGCVFIHHIKDDLYFGLCGEVKCPDCHSWVKMKSFCKKYTKDQYDKILYEVDDES